MNGVVPGTAAAASAIPVRLNTGHRDRRRDGSSGVPLARPRMRHTGGGLALAAIVFSFANNTIFSLLHECVHGTFHPRSPRQRRRGRLVRGVLPDILHDPAGEPLRASSPQPHRSRALRLLPAAPVALAEDLLDLLPADGLLLGDHSGRRLFISPARSCSEAAGFRMDRRSGGDFRNSCATSPGTDRTASGRRRSSRSRSRPSVVVRAWRSTGRAGCLLLGIRTQLELTAIHRPRLEPTRRARRRLEPALLADHPGDLPQLQSPPRASPRADIPWTQLPGLVRPE